MTEQPDGNCKIVWQKLTQKCLPKTAPSYIKLKNEFANSTLGDVSTPPDKWVSELESLRNQMNTILIPNKSDMTEVDLIIHILSNLPEEYKVAVAELEKDMQSQTKPLEMENVRRVLDSRFERLSKNTDVFDESGEKVFAAWAKKQYNGICGKCGEYGHLSNNCPKSKPNRFKSQNNGDDKSSNSKRPPPGTARPQTRSAAGADGTVTPPNIARAGTSGSAS